MTNNSKDTDKRYYSFTYRSEVPESDYQLIIPRSVNTAGKILLPSNQDLFNLLFGLLMIGSQQRIGNPLFSQYRCLEYHYFECELPKRDFVVFTKRMYLDHIGGVEMTPLKKELHREIMGWFTEKEMPSFIYEEEHRISKIADLNDAMRMDIPVGHKYTELPLPKGNDEAFERLERMSGQMYFEYLMRKFFEKYAVPDKKIIADELEPIFKFIDDANKHSIKDAFSKIDTNKAHEFLRIKHNYYKNHMCEYEFGSVASYVFGELFLYKNWLEQKLSAYSSISGGGNPSIEDTFKSGFLFTSNDIIK